MAGVKDKCLGVTRAGDPCPYKANPAYENYCGVHKSLYFATTMKKRLDELEAKVGVQEKKVEKVDKMEERIEKMDKRMDTAEDSVADLYDKGFQLQKRVTTFIDFCGVAFEKLCNYVFTMGKKHRELEEPDSGLVSPQRMRRKRGMKEIDWEGLRRQRLLESHSRSEHNRGQFIDQRRRLLLLPPPT